MQDIVGLYRHLRCWALLGWVAIFVQAENAQQSLSRDEAIDEIVADASMDRMGDKAFWQAVAENLGEDRAEVRGKIAQFFDKYLGKIKEALRTKQVFMSRVNVARLEKQMQDALSALYAEGIREAAKNRKALTGTATETKNAATEGGEVQYSTKSKYEDQVDAVLANTHDPNNHVNMGRAPVKLSNILGLPKLPMLATTNHIYTITVSGAKAQQDGRFNRKSHYHNLGRDTTVALPSLLNDPVLILKSNQDNTNAEFVVVTNHLDQNKDPIIAAIKPGGKGNYWNFEFLDNAFLSGYGKENFRDYIARAKTENRILYANKNSQ